MAINSSRFIDLKVLERSETTRADNEPLSKEHKTQSDRWRRVVVWYWEMFMKTWLTFGYYITCEYVICTYYLCIIYIYIIYVCRVILFKESLH